MSEKVCAVPGCDRKSRTRALCGKHYQSKAAREEYGAQPRVHMHSLAERLSQYEIDPVTGCWLWSAGRGGMGYGVVVVGAGKKPAHRASYEFHVGPIPPGAHVCHRCDTPLCIRPDHLFLGSHADNMADMAAKNRAGSRPHETCQRGHEWTPETTLTPPSGGRQCKTCNHERYLERRRAKGLPDGRPAKTHCPQGHAFTEENTYITEGKLKHCRICGREASRRYAAKKKSAAG